MPAAKRDPEITALDRLIAVLEPLDDEARARVLDYAMRRLGMHEIATSRPLPPTQPAPEAQESRSPTVAARTTPVSVATDIRSLREQKAPGSAIEMAALVAYYLSDLAPEDDRKHTVTTADLDRFFKQAGHPLPNRLANTLSNAAAAGYFDTTATRGEYKLNPVGYNLVTQTLPRSSGTLRPASRKRASAKASPRAKSAGTAAASSTTRPKKRATKKRAG